jgi:hypothetical protein
VSWEPAISPNKGETICLVLQLTKAVKARVVFYGPDGFWYAVLIVAGRRVSDYVKATSEEDAKVRALEQARTFARQLMVALDEVELVGTDPA